MGLRVKREKKAGLLPLENNWCSLKKEGSCMATRFEIVDGPSKFDLMLALFDVGFKGKYPRGVIFTIDDKQRKVGWSGGQFPPLVFLIDSLSREDGSCENWNWEGVCVELDIEHLRTKGFFSTKTRKGWVEIEGI
jgi:hypothetical protein